MRCLLVDDEPGIREGLAMLLRRRGYEVETAADCAGAAAALRAQAFDVVVTDWRLPDGTAGGFAAGCDCPVLAVSGHPEEVDRSGAIRDAIAKPVRPDALLARIGALLAPPVEDDEETALCRDVQVVVDDLLAQLPEDAEVSCHDDGTFVVFRATLPDGAPPAVTARGGDARLVRTETGDALEVRMYRDGRPAADLRVVPVDAAWPTTDAFGLDCQDTVADRDTFARWRAAVAERNAAGGRICLLNVPDRLDSPTPGYGTTHDMPMRARVGPSLPAELTELWS
ncbi:MAG: response regulator transcription factor [Planctomycetota bacterium]